MAAPVRAAGRGLVAAMAMSGMREVTTGLGWLDRTPPEEIVSEEAPALVRSLSEGRERVVIQLAHWGYGVAAGAAFGLLPERFRRSRAAGPAYGLSTWLLFELVVAPVLGVDVSRGNTVKSRISLIADHVLYGIVVAGQLAPERPRSREKRPLTSVPARRRVRMIGQRSPHPGGAGTGPVS